MKTYTGPQNLFDCHNISLLAEAPELLEVVKMFLKDFEGVYAESEPAVIRAKEIIERLKTSN